VEHVSGTLEEIIATGNVRQMTVDIWPQVCTYARSAFPDDFLRARGKAYAMFKEMTGQMAKADFYQTAPAKLTAQVLKKLENMDKAWWARNRGKRRKAA
jgi:hypothetical protein